MTGFQGKHILVTRPEPQGSELCKVLMAMGAHATHLPTLAFAPPSDQQAYEAAIAALGEQDMLIFISPQAVYSSIPDIRRRWPQFPSSLRFAAVGEGTAQALHEAGYVATLYPAIERNSEGLLALPEFQSIVGMKIAIIRGEGGRELIDKTLALRGAHVLPVLAYQRILPPIHMGPMLEAVKQQALDVIVCTSFQGVKNLKLLFGDAGWPYIRAVPLLVMSERIKRLAQDLGFQTIWVTTHASSEAILQALLRLYS
jgi:uroporphyrinogen-III synthase